LYVTQRKIPRGRDQDRALWPRLGGTLEHLY